MGVKVVFGFLVKFRFLWRVEILVFWVSFCSGGWWILLGSWVVFISLVDDFFLLGWLWLEVWFFKVWLVR